MLLILSGEHSPHLQLLQYILNIFESIIKEGLGLIPVFPIVFYHEEKKMVVRDIYSYLDNIDIPNFVKHLTEIFISLELLMTFLTPVLGIFYSGLGIPLCGLELYIIIIFF